MYLLAAALGHCVNFFTSDIARMLGGAPSVFTVVPSTRGKPPELQRLYQILGLIDNLLPRIAPLVRFEEGQVFGRGEFSPNKFTGDKSRIRGQRIVLVEDSWISGGTAISTLERLRDDGAESAILLTISRRIEPGAIAARQAVDQCYLTNTDKKWEPSSLVWPRPK